ncbi:MAG: hypothetical protein MUC96_35545, partial [Myxococcaceae bacterium]|nr:hypothetical protein [Myxococcaceae bacterium]
ENSQYDEACGMLESASQVDARLRRIHGANFAAYRAQQDQLHKLAMLQELETGVLYHSTGTDPRRLNGFTPRYDSTTRPSGGSQVIRCDAAASGADQTSAWLIKWAEDACYMIYPPSSMGGIKSEDMGLVDVRDASGLTYPAFKTYHSWEPGLVIEDYRQVCRVCNIDTGSLAANGSNIIEAMIRAYHQIQNPNGGRLRWYVNRTVATFLHLQSRAGGINNPAVVTQYEGRPMLTFLEIPVRVTDSILTTEAVVS